VPGRPHRLPDGGIIAGRRAVPVELFDLADEGLGLLADYPAVAAEAIDLQLEVGDVGQQQALGFRLGRMIVGYRNEPPSSPAGATPAG